MRNTVQHINQNDGNVRGLSGMFRQFGLDQAQLGHDPGVFIFEDFICPDATISAGEYRGFDFNDAAVGLATEHTGAITIGSGDTTVTYCATHPLLDIDVDAESPTLAAVEFRFQVDDLAAPIFIGFCDNMGTVIDDSGITAASTAIGISKVPGAAVFKAYVTDGAAANVVGNDSATIAVDTWIKAGVRLGRKYDGTGIQAEFMVNGARLGIADLKNVTSMVDISDSLAGISVKGDYTTTIDFGAYYTNL